MIIELKTKTCLISNRRNRMLLTLVSPVWAKYFMTLCKKYRIGLKKLCLFNSHFYFSLEHRKWFYIPELWFYIPELWFYIPELWFYIPELYIPEFTMKYYAKLKIRFIYVFLCIQYIVDRTGSLSFQKRLD